MTANDRIQQHREVKSERHDLFTGSGAGITGAAAGALVGGLAAQKAQEGKGHGRGKRDESLALTLLGAAVGGLAVNAAVDSTSFLLSPIVF